MRLGHRESALGVLCAGVLLVACSSEPVSSQSDSSPVTSLAPSATSDADSDARLLPPVTSSVMRDDSLEGQLDVRLTTRGVCASLRNPATPYNGGPFVRWPVGYRVVGGDPLRLQDARGHFVAHEGDYLWLSGEANDVARRVIPDDAACPMPGGRSFDVVRVSKPGRPLGVDERKVMLMDWCMGRPETRPENLTLACDGGRYLSDIQWTAWSRNGATGTARLFERCYDPIGSDSMWVTFTYTDVVGAFSLRLLKGLRIDYPREPCS
jgi:hypothetical protein